MPGAMHSASGFNRIEVVTGVERRRRWSLGEKLKAVEETLSSGMSVSYVARKYGISPSLLFRWRKLMTEGGKEAIRSDDAVVSAAEVRELKKRIRELERVLGKKTLENEILTEAVKLAHEKKKDKPPSRGSTGPLGMKAIADTMRVARSHLVERMKAGETPARCRYHKTDDAWLLPLIRELVDSRATYGYRRICALLNRKLEGMGKPAVNHKRVYRIMRQNGLLLTRHTGKQPKPHEGKVITLRSNLRWCSDGFEISCWNGQVVRVAFALDCCDREVISHVATTGGITGEMVRDLMTESVERRFGMVDLLPHRVEWLSDNGSCYTASETTAFAKDMGFISCFTPVRSPESNGMAEAFVKTFKRDYVYVHDRPDAKTIMAQLHQWFEDYNEYHPHKGLKMKSPRQFIRSQLLTASCPV